MKNNYAKIIGFAFFFSGLVFADSSTPEPTAIMETDWLELTPGYKGKLLGAEITKIEKLDNSDLTRIEITVPNEKKRNFEEVIVRGKRGNSEYDIKLDKRIEVIKDLDAGKTGIVIQVGGDKPFKLLINYIDYNADTKNYQ